MLVRALLLMICCTVMTNLWSMEGLGLIPRERRTLMVERDAQEGLETSLVYRLDEDVLTIRREEGRECNCTLQEVACTAICLIELVKCLV